MPPHAVKIKKLFENKRIFNSLYLRSLDDYCLLDRFEKCQLGYIYAILFSPAYRERYYEFLKYDFPRIPLLTDIKYFRKLAALGQNLINWHLLQEVQIPTRHRFEGEGDAVVSKIRYAGGHVWINPTQRFTDVPEAVWEYEIGAYQGCEKWLRDRKGSPLSHAEVRHYCAILVAIAETLKIMAEIDAAFDPQIL